MLKRVFYGSPHKSHVRFYCLKRVQLCIKIWLPCWVFYFLLFRQSVTDLVTIVLNSTLAVVNNYHQTVNNNIVQASVQNNREQLPVAFIRHKCTKNIIKRTYTDANPNPLSYKQPNVDDLMALSALLQHRTWPLCMKNPQCEKPTFIHRPDVCVVFKELDRLVLEWL